MNAQTAVVLGASGLVGNELLQQLLADDAFDRVRILVRSAIELQHPKLEICITDFSDYNSYRKNLGKGDCIFCCIGTTIKKVKGDKALYRSIDFDIPVNAARFGKEAGFQQYLLVSAVGANSSSRLFYTRLKGEVEEVISTFNFSGFHIFRPSFLLGHRKEQRTGERIAKTLSQWLHVLIPSNYKGIEARDVAAAMIRKAKQASTGVHIYYYRHMTENT
ncbi:MAG: NAD(P)H-binding protein [Chitinophagaceae bacterium]|nr:NAD(P)H-binding protein [Chitinophagaceae bacterium]